MSGGQEPVTSLATFLSTTVLAVALIGGGFLWMDDEGEGSGMEPAASESVGSGVAAARESEVEATAPEDEAASDAALALRGRAEAFYAAVGAEDETAADGFFLPDALIAYEMDFGGTYPSEAFSCRVLECPPIRDEDFEGYEMLTWEYAVESVKRSADGGVVTARITERYRWAGYEGVMKGEERLTFVERYGDLYLAAFEVSQVYQ